jgi:hypothetical protein
LLLENCSVLLACQISFDILLNIIFEVGPILGFFRSVVVCFALTRAINSPSWHSFKSLFISFPFETYNQFCLYQNNPSYNWKCNMTPFHKSPIICLANLSHWLASWMFFYLLFPTYTNLIWCFLFNALGTTFSFPCLCWMLTSEIATTSCHLTYLVNNTGRVEGTSRWHCLSKYNIFKTYVMAPSLEVIHHCPHFLIMCWSP